MVAITRITRELSTEDWLIFWQNTPDATIIGDQIIAGGRIGVTAEEADKIILNNSFRKEFTDTHEVWVIENSIQPVKSAYFP